MIFDSKQIIYNPVNKGEMMTPASVFYSLVASIHKLNKSPKYHQSRQLNLTMDSMTENNKWDGKLDFHLTIYNIRISLPLYTIILSISGD